MGNRRHVNVFLLIRGLVGNNAAPSAKRERGRRPSRVPARVYTTATRPLNKSSAR